MTTDHSEFIERRKMPRVGALRWWRLAGNKGGHVSFLWGAVLLVVLYAGFGGLAVLFAQDLHVSGETVGIVTGALFGASLFGFGLHTIGARLAPACWERELLRQVLEGSRGARLIIDGNRRTVYYNGKFNQLCRSPNPGLESLVALFPNQEEVKAHFYALMDEAVRGLSDSVALCAVQDGREKWLQITVQPVSGWEGVVHWRVDDITAQRAVDSAILEEREKLIDFTDNAPVGFFSVDEEGRFVFVNAAMARWLGVDIQKLLNTGTLHAFLAGPPKDVAPYDVLPGGGPKQIGEIQMKGPAGTVFLASISQTVVKEPDGKVRTRAVVHDLTTEKEMRQALKASEDRFQRFFEEAPLGIAIVDPDGVIRDCNSALAALLGSAPEKIEGKSFETLLDHDDSGTVFSTLSRIEQGRPMGAPLEIMLHNGGKKDVSVQFYARKFKGSDNIVLHFIDLTEQKTLEQQFTQSQKMQAVGQLAGGVAHDFNNLLTAMIGFCDLLLLRHKPGDPSFGDIMQIKQNANRAANLVRQLLAFSRQQTLRPRVQDVAEILTEISYLLRRLLGANVELEVVHGEDIGLVKVDEGQMEQVLINLAVNARDAMEEDGGGHLTIRTSNVANAEPMECGSDEMPAGHWVRIAVEDTGCGIPRENMERIFEPFFTTKKVGQGTGLGLATVYGIIRQTGGYLGVKSKVGKGATFEIYLPVVPDSEVEEAVRPSSDDEEDRGGDLTGTARVLLVEDEDAVRTFSARALGNKGYEVFQAESGEAALNVLAGLPGGSLDLVITDVIMPNMDGPTLVRRLREDMPTLKIIFISGYTEEKLKDHMGENIWFLPKPFTLKQLAAKVKEALDEGA